MARRFLARIPPRAVYGSVAGERAAGAAQPGSVALECYNLILYGGYSSAAERRSVAPDVVGSNPTSRPTQA